MVTGAADQAAGLAELLWHCEEQGAAPKYVVREESCHEAKSPFFGPALPARTQPVDYDAEGREIYVVSDLHIASGRNVAGVYRGTENFFADDSFLRFIEGAIRDQGTKKALLVINGDIFDFLRVMDYPGRMRTIRLSKRLKQFLKLDPVRPPDPPPRQMVDAQFGEWSDELAKVGIAMTPGQLEAAISPRDRKYGLGTADFKTVYKLMKIRSGHPGFYQALGTWMEHGHRLMILKGNHDLELYWPAIRNYLRLQIAGDILGRNPARSLPDILQQVVLPNITFIDDSVVIDGDFYVEHGHRYDKFTMVLGSPVLAKRPGLINIPFGSFFNRYLINRIELYYPFMDNVRPSGNVLPMLMKSNFPLGLKVLFQHIPLLLRVLLTSPRYVWFMGHRVVWFLLALAAPVIYVVAKLPYLESLPVVTQISDLIKSNWAVKLLSGQLKVVATLLLSYLLTRVVSWFQLSEPESLDKYARIRFQDSGYRIMTMGHTHNPGEYVFQNGERFYNTGTWIPVIETSTAAVRPDKTYTFLHLIRDEDGRLQPAANGLLQRWNDDAGRADALVLVERK